MPLHTASLRVLCSGVLACTLMGQADAQVASLTFAPVVQSSHWDERDAQGHVLLQERGTLTGLRLGGQYQLAAWQLGVLAQALSGRRQYDGQTNDGVPVQTHVNVDLNEAQLSGHYRSEAGWLAGVEWGRRSQRRELLSVPGVATGYTERWISQEWRLRAGVHWQAAGLWQASLAVAPWAQTHMKLSSSSADAAVLHPRRQQAAQLDLNWQAPASGAWTWGLSTQFDWRRTLRSDPVAWTRNGSLRGTLTQPETREVLYGAGVELIRTW